jgi:hypothetical protein
MKVGMPALLEFGCVRENADFAHSLGLDFVELNLNLSYCRKSLASGNFREELGGLEATLHFFDEADFGTYPEVVDAYLTLLDRYCGYGEGKIRQVNVHLHSGPVVTISGVKHYVYEKEFDEYADRLLKGLSKAREICASHKMNLVVENTDDLPPYATRVYEKLAEAKIPHYTGADSFALNGAFLGYGVNYSDLGTATADMVVDVLVNGADPASTPVRTLNNGIATVNIETAEAIGLDYSMFEDLCEKVIETRTAQEFSDAEETES